MRMLISFWLKVWLLCLYGSLHPDLVSASCDTCSCPPPEDKGFGWRLPYYAHTEPQLSYDLRYLLMEPGYRLELSTLQPEPIELVSDIPRSTILGYSILTWSPYSSDLVAMMAPMMVDTSTNNSPHINRQNLFKYRFSTKESTLLTPEIVQPFGAEMIGFVTWFGQPGWFYTSTPESDTFRIAIRLDTIRFGGLYIPQSQTLIPHSIARGIHRNSRDGRHSIWGDGPDLDNWTYYIDSQKIGFLMPADQVSRASFSPDASLFSLEVWQKKVDTNRTYRQVWIYRTDDPSEPIHRINFQELHCMYSFHGIWPEFITDSTLAVSMHKDGDISSPLWEIGLDGHIIRQLTFLPTNAVAREELPKTLRYVRVEAEIAHIEIEPSPIIRTITLVNTVGQAVLSKNVDIGAESCMIDVRSLPQGLYFGHVSGTGEILRVLIER